MKKTDAKQVTASPARWLTGMLVLTGIVLVALFCVTFDSYQNNAAGQLRNLRLTELQGTIAHLDDVLTMSARLAAATGDPRWEQLYRQHEEQLDQAIQEAIHLTSDANSAAAIAQTNAANNLLADMETNSFALVRAGQAGQATAILSSGTYATQEKIYAQGLATILSHLDAQLAGSVITQQNKALFSVVSLGACIILLFLTWIPLLARLARDNTTLQEAVATRRQDQVELQWKTAFLEAQVNSSIDGILVVDGQGRKILQNQLMTDLLKIPQSIAEDKDDGKQVEWVRNIVKNSASFIEKVAYLNAHRNEISRDIIELKDGTILDRYSAPVLGPNEEYYGRIWTFRDVTGQKQIQDALQRQKAELQVLFDLIPAMIWFKDTKNRVLRVNKRVADTAGKTIEEIEGRTSLENYPEEAAKYYADDLEVIHSGQPKLGIVETIHNREGKELWVQTDKVPYRNKAGLVIGIVVMAQDITARMQAEESLRLLGSAVQQAKESILITDAQLDLPGPKIVFVNPAFTRMTGYTAPEALGKTPRILQGPRTDKIVLQRLRQNLERGEAFDGEAINYRKDGQEYDQAWQITPIRQTGGKITHFVAIQRDVSEHRRIEEALRESELRYRAFFEQAAIGVAQTDMEGHFLLTNQRYADIVGRTRAELQSCTFQEITHPEDVGSDLGNLQLLLTGKNQTYSTRKRYIRKDGTIVWVNLTVSLVRDHTGNPKHFLAVAEDITEAKRLETQLFQSQKLETVGKLAGGVAHEFNSIMTAIIGQSELLLNALPPGDVLNKNATEILKAAERAATLTQQLLAYGRKQILQPEILDLNSVLAGMETTLRHLMGHGVDVMLVLATGLKAVKADAGQLEQVIMNLAMNAADAMPDGGKFTLETVNLTIGEAQINQFPEIKAGNYVMLTVSDTGTGMSEEAKARAFEPFFTTKGVGQGTGLGLSTCYGIIKQSGGHIQVYSEVLHGTTFKIYLPSAESREMAPRAKLQESDLPRGVETILLVENDPALREMGATLLRRLGYTVLAAANGREALNLQQGRENRPIDLLFTDVVMPQMSGKELSEQVQILYPHIKILFTTAYTENAVVHQGTSTRGVALLPKPFTPGSLARKLREVLDRPKS